MKQQYEQYKVRLVDGQTEAKWWWRRIVNDSGYFIGDWVWATRYGGMADTREWEIKKQLRVTVCPDGCLMVLDKAALSYSGV